MIDYGIDDRRKFLRQLRLLALLRGFQLAVCGLSIGAALAAIINLFSRGQP